MARLKRFELRVSVRMVAGLLSVMLHLGLFLVVVASGGRQDGVDDDDTPITRVAILESPKADPRDGVELRPLALAVPATNLRLRLNLQAIPPPSPFLLDREPETAPDADRDSEDADDADGSSPVEMVATSEIAPASATHSEPTVVLPQAQASALLRRIERLAERTLKNEPRATVTWKRRGRQYNAELVLERAQDGVEPDRVVADISSEDRGRQLKTRIVLKRVAYSHFTKIIDFWDPMVELHDDEIDGRVHFNSRLNVLSDSQARPTLLGKVSTSAGSVHVRSVGQGRESDVFREGIRTGAGYIPLSRQVDRLESALRDADARVHEFAADTRIRFLADGSYSWRSSRSDVAQHHEESSAEPVYFIAARGATLYVQGVVAGRVLVFSPERIVVEGNLTYANDPRDVPDSADYLGLVCDRDIEVAPPRVTGPGDVHIQAALFARRRFVVADFEHPRSGTLRIYGSLAAGSVTATEPRYAMKVEYDRRFEQVRPPGFPSTNRFAVEDWDGRWTEVPERSASAEY